MARFRRKPSKTRRSFPFLRWMLKLFFTLSALALALYGGARIGLVKLMQGHPWMVRGLSQLLQAEVLHQPLEGFEGGLEVRNLKALKLGGMIVSFDRLKCSWSSHLKWRGPVQLKTLELEGLEVKFLKRASSLWGLLGLKKKLLAAFPSIEVEAFQASGGLHWESSNLHVSLPEIRLNQLTLSFPVTLRGQGGSCRLDASAWSAESQRELNIDAALAKFKNQCLKPLQRQSWDLKLYALDLELKLPQKWQRQFEKQQLFFEKILVQCSQIQVQSSLWSIEALVLLGNHALGVRGNCDLKGRTPQVLSMHLRQRGRDLALSTLTFFSGPSGVSVQIFASKKAIFRKLISQISVDWDWGRCCFELNFPSWSEVKVHSSWEWEGKVFWKIQAEAQRKKQGWVFSLQSKPLRPLDLEVQHPSPWGPLEGKIKWHPEVSVEGEYPQSVINLKNLSRKLLVSGNLKFHEIHLALQSINIPQQANLLSTDEVLLSEAKEEALNFLSPPWKVRFRGLKLEWPQGSSFGLQGTPSVLLEGDLRLEGELFSNDFQVYGHLHTPKAAKNSKLSSESHGVLGLPFGIESLELEANGASSEVRWLVALKMSKKRRENLGAIESIRLQGNLNQLQRLQIKLKSDAQFNDFYWDFNADVSHNLFSPSQGLGGLLQDWLGNFLSHFFKKFFLLDVFENSLQEAIARWLPPAKVSLGLLALEDDRWLIEALEIDWGRLVIGGGVFIPFPKLFEAQIEPQEANQLYIEGVFHLTDWMDFIVAILPKLKIQANLQGEW